MAEDAFGRDDEVQDWIAAAQAIARKRKEPVIDVDRHCAEPYPVGIARQICQHCRRASKGAFGIHTLSGFGQIRPWGNQGTNQLLTGNGGLSAPGENLTTYPPLDAKRWPGPRLRWG